MLGPIGSNLMAVFRLLSPDEIDKYIVREDEETVSQSFSLAAGGEEFTPPGQHQNINNTKRASQKFSTEQQAEIIPIRGKLENDEFTSGESEEHQPTQEKKEHFTQHPSATIQPGGETLESIGVLSASRIKQIENDRLKKENSKKDSATVFLLKERAKLKSSKKKMIEQIAFKCYQTNAAQEFYEEKEEDVLDEDATNDLKGILLNKRHY